MNEAKKELKQFLKMWLRKHTRCATQHDGWTCGTCLYAITNEMKMPKSISEKFWQLSLWVRGDYDGWDFDKADEVR